MKAASGLRNAAGAHCRYGNEVEHTSTQSELCAACQGTQLRDRAFRPGACDESGQGDDRPGADGRQRDSRQEEVNFDGAKAVDQRRLHQLPLDDDYAPIFQALIFTIYACGFRPRSAREVDDGGQTRIEKLFRIIEQCRYGIHDLSRTELDELHQLPRFNMPLELGMFLGAKHYGDEAQRDTDWPPRSSRHRPSVLLRPHSKGCAS